MKIALLGYGKMGKEIEQIALSRKHEISLVIDLNNAHDLNPDNLKNIDVAIDFSTPDSAYNNITACLKNNVPVVCGTTGWLDKFKEIVTLSENQKVGFFYASNYSVGVNIFFKLNEYLAKIMNNFKQYNVNIEETHHTQKLDAPSGTAISLAEGLLKNYTLKKGWKLDTDSPDNKDIPVKAIREADVPGIHEITYESDVDFVKIKHAAKSRKGFALGAVLAAEFILNKQGYVNMDDMLNIS